MGAPVYSKHFYYVLEERSSCSICLLLNYLTFLDHVFQTNEIFAYIFKIDCIWQSNL